MSELSLNEVLTALAAHHDGVRQGGSLYEIQADGDAMVVYAAAGWGGRQKFVLRAEAGPCATPGRCPVSQRLDALTKVPCAPHRGVDEACVAHRPIACVLTDGHDGPCAPGLPPLAPDWTLTVDDLCAVAVRDVLAAADQHHAPDEHVDPSGPAQFERAWAAKTHQVGTMLYRSSVTEEGFRALFFPSGVQDATGRALGSHAGFVPDGQNRGLWAYENAEGTRVVSTLRWDAPAEAIADWTRHRIVQRDLLDVARLAFFEGSTDAPRCPCGNDSMSEGYYPVHADGAPAPEGGSGYILCGGCGRLYTDAPSVADAGSDVVERTQVLDEEEHVYFRGAGVQLDVLGPEVVAAAQA